MSCVFCEIAAGRAEADVLCDWGDALAIVPLNPVSLGHTLVIPKRHVADALEDPVTTGLVMARAAAFAAGQGAHGYNLITSVGSVATQTVMHLHAHVVPRRPGDGLALPWTGQEKRTYREGLDDGYRMGVGE
ncbi:HIT family protein [Longimicrobium sp.]|jgi:histidine triad (HIT) family protein|uniref:HIT family protein n=1 Tax=Longimicrobium sp. TaxID=2029185 RepID=UPI002EDA853B